MIVVMHWILVLKLTLVLKLGVLLSSHRSPLLERMLWLPLAIQLSGKNHEDSDYTAMNAVMHLDAKTHPSGEVVSVVIIFCLLPATTACSTQTAWSSCNVRWQYSSQERPWIFWLHCHEYHGVLMLRCQNSPWWRSCEHCNNFFAFLLAAIARSIHSSSMVITCYVH